MKYVFNSYYKSILVDVKNKYAECWKNGDCQEIKTFETVEKAYLYVAVMIDEYYTDYPILDIIDSNTHVVSNVVTHQIKDIVPHIIKFKELNQ